MELCLQRSRVTLIVPIGYKSDILSKLRQPHRCLLGKTMIVGVVCRPPDLDSLS